jgi:hypothetical protein
MREVHQIRPDPEKRLIVGKKKERGIPDGIPRHSLATKTGKTGRPTVTLICQRIFASGFQTASFYVPR